MSSCLGPVGNYSWLAPGWLRFNLILCVLRRAIWWYFLPDDTAQTALKTRLELTGHQSVVGSSLIELYVISIRKNALLTTSISTLNIRPPWWEARSEERKERGIADWAGWSGPPPDVKSSLDCVCRIVQNGCAGIYSLLLMWKWKWKMIIMTLVEKSASNCLSVRALYGRSRQKS